MVRLPSRDLVRALLSIALSAAICSAASPKSGAVSGRAAPPARNLSLSDELRGAARDAYEQARELYEAGDFATSHAKFTQAFELSKNPRLLFNMAACSSKMKRYARALGELDRELREGRGRLAEDQLEKAAAFRATLSGLVAPMQLEVVPTDASVQLDGEARELTPPRGELALDVGRHELRVTREGFEPSIDVIDVRETKPFARRVVLVPISTRARLIVHAPQDARLSLDDAPLAIGSFDGKISVGPHRLRAEAVGRQPYEVTLEASANSTRELTLELRTDSPRESSASWWPWALGGALAVGATVGAVIILQPDAERALPPSGTLGSFSVR